MLFRLLKIALLILMFAFYGAGPSLAFYIGQHWVIGTVEAESEELLSALQDKEVRIYLRTNPSFYLSDIIGINGLSGKEDQFQVNIFENPSWEPYSEIGILLPPLNINNKKYAALAEAATTHKGFDFLWSPLKIVEADTIPAKISLGFEQLILTATAGGAPPDPANLSIYNEGFNSLNYTATKEGTWLSLNPNAGTVLAQSSTSTKIIFNTQGLVPDIYTATIWVSDPAASNQVETASIILNLYSAFELLHPSANNINLSVLNSLPLENTVIAITNESSVPVSFIATTEAAWINLTLGKSVLGTKESTTLVLSYDLSNLAPGTYEATLWLINTEDPEQKKIINIKLTIKEPPLSPDVIELTIVTTQGADIPNETITLTNNTDQPITYQITTDASWISIHSPTGTLNPGESVDIILSFNTEGLPPGEYSATVWVTDPNHPDKSMPITVTLKIESSDILVDDNVLELETATGTNAPDTTITITNNTDQPLTYLATTDASWITIKNPTETLNPGESKDLILSFDTSNLPPGTYEATIWITDPNDPSRTRTITVTLVVEPSLINTNKTSISGSATEGKNPEAQTFILTNASDQPFNFIVETGAPWLTVSPSAGAINPGEQLGFSIIFNTEGLVPGTYETFIKVYDPNDPTKTVMLPVKITIKPKEQPGTPPQVTKIFFGTQQYSEKYAQKGKKFIISKSPVIKATVSGESGIDTSSLSLAIDAGSSAEKILTISSANFTSVIVSENKPVEISYTYQLAKEDALSEGIHNIGFKAGNQFGNTMSIVTVEVMAGSSKVLDIPLTYPSPFSPLRQGHSQVIIAYTLNLDANIDIYLFNISGEIVKKFSIAAGTPGGAAGYNKITWNGVSDFGDYLANGIYIGTIVSKDDGRVLAKFKLTVFD